MHQIRARPNTESKHPASALRMLGRRSLRQWVMLVFGAFSPLRGRRTGSIRFLRFLYNMARIPSINYQSYAVLRPLTPQRHSDLPPPPSTPPIVSGLFRSTLLPVGVLNHLLPQLFTLTGDPVSRPSASSSNFSALYKGGLLCVCACGPTSISEMAASTRVNLWIIAIRYFLFCFILLFVPGQPPNESRQQIEVRLGKSVNVPDDIR